jgi:hypothetical protein
MVDDILKKKVTGRKVDDQIFKGTTPVNLPNPDNEAQMERHFAKEENANWKIICLGNEFSKCGQIKYLSTMDIGQVDAVVKFWHPTHKKALYNRVTMGNMSYRGTIPNIDTADGPSKRIGGKVG